MSVRRNNLFLKEAAEAGVGGLQPLVAVEVDLLGWWWKKRGAGLDANGPRFLGGCLLDSLLQHYLLQLSDMANGVRENSRLAKMTGASSDPAPEHRAECFVFLPDVLHFLLFSGVFLFRCAWSTSVHWDSVQGLPLISASATSSPITAVAATGRPRLRLRQTPVCVFFFTAYRST